MNKFAAIICLTAFISHAQNTALTLYNQDFAVVREQIELELNRGETHVAFSEITAHAEPDSVILRDLSGQNTLRILEQNYRADPVSQNLLLNHFEGREIDFLSGTNVIRGKIIRSGYLPYYYAARHYAAALTSQPIIEVDGQLRFSLPGQPLFPNLGTESILKPTVNWLLHSAMPGKTTAELCYVSSGLRWEADYNIVAPEKGDTVDLIGWVTMDNRSGHTFKDAKIKLMAGDVEKIDTSNRRQLMKLRSATTGYATAEPAVSEKAFDEYHLYELGRKTTLRDQQIKQVEFLRAENMQSHTVYIYDGAKISDNSIRRERDYGTQSNPKVWVMREFENTKDNGLGVPLPKGRVRFYRRDTDEQLEFTGENMIDHTPKDETVRLFTGNSFDLIGERIRTNYQIDSSASWLNESFEIKLRNRKETDAVEIRVVEHLYRALNWNIAESSNPWKKTDSNTMEFRITVQPGEEKVITYTAHYSW